MEDGRLLTSGGLAVAVALRIVLILSVKCFAKSDSVCRSELRHSRLFYEFVKFDQAHVFTTFVDFVTLSAEKS